MFAVRQIELNKKQSEQVLKLLEVGFNEKFSKDWLMWKYTKNPLLKGNKPLVYAAIEEETENIIGLMAYMPNEININGKILNGVQACDIVVSPDYRNRGVFTLLSSESRRQLEDTGVDLIFCFPNFNSMPGLLRQGYKKVGLLDEQYFISGISKVVEKSKKNFIYQYGSKIFDLTLPSLNKLTGKIEKIASKDLVISRDTNFTEELVVLGEFNDKNKYKIKKRLEYLNWRYKERPDKEYTIWKACRNNRPVAYLVTTISQGGGLIQGQIVDFQYTRMEDFLALLKHSMNFCFYEEECNLINIWTFTDSVIFSKLNKLGFISKSKFPIRYFITERQLLLNVLNKSVSSDIEKMQSWSLRASDKDIY